MPRAPCGGWPRPDVSLVLPNHVYVPIRSIFELSTGTAGVRGIRSAGEHDMVLAEARRTNVKAFTANLHRIRGLLLVRASRAERGATLVEYAVLVGVMAGVVLVSVTLLGSRISDLIESLPAMPVLG